jgi:hypothetical protein
MEAKVLPNALGNNLAYPMFKENIRYLLHVIFVTSFYLFIYFLL